MRARRMVVRWDDQLGQAVDESVLDRTEELEFVRARILSDFD
jgi:hypothetical protein